MIIMKKASSKDLLFVKSNNIIEWIYNHIDREKLINDIKNKNAKLYESNYHSIKKQSMFDYIIYSHIVRNYSCYGVDLEFFTIAAIKKMLIADLDTSVDNKVRVR